MNIKIILAMALSLCLLAIPATATWWNESWQHRYEVNATESTGYNRMSAPIKINLSNFICANADKSDARFVSPGGDLIPSYVTSRKEMVVILNISANISNSNVGYIYCNATGQTASINVGTLSSNIIAGNSGNATDLYVYVAQNNTFFHIQNSHLFGGGSDNGMTWDNSSVGFNFRAGGTQIGDGGCNITDNNSLYIRLDCLSNDITTHYEFFDNNKLTHIWVDANGYSSLVGIHQYFADQPSFNQRFMIYGTDANTWTTISGTPFFATLERNAYAYRNWNNKDNGIVVTYNKSQVFQTPNSNQFYIHLRSAYGDPDGCIGTQSENNCWGAIMNVSWFTYDSKFWIGQGNTTYSEMTKLEQTKMNPISPMLGAGEKLPCNSSWVCSGYDSCLLNNTQVCNAVTDSNFCGENYTGNYSEFTPQVCDFCTPAWSCSLNGFCNSSDQERCIEVNDSNSCNESYTGNYSEFGTQACDYCTPSFSCSIPSMDCEEHQKQCLNVTDANGCYAETSLSSDEFDGNLTPYAMECGYLAQYNTSDLRDITGDVGGNALMELLNNITMIVAIGVAIYAVKVVNDKIKEKDNLQ